MKAKSNKAIEFVEILSVHPGLQKVFSKFDTVLGKPVWWLASKPHTDFKQFYRVLNHCCKVWPSYSSQKLKYAKNLFSEIKNRSRETSFFLCESPKGIRHFCMPIHDHTKCVGYFGLSSLDKSADWNLIEILRDNIDLIVSNVRKDEEINRLSATLRPRAVALSTVHTVHRIINSTLNLDELVTRLAHLTAQVLRANRCLIYMIEPQPILATARKPKKNAKPNLQLRCRAIVGYPGDAGVKKIMLMGKGLEGIVAKTAKINLKKDFICVPLIDEDVIGVMMVSKKKDDKEFNYFDQEILATLAEEAVIAIKNARLYEEQRRVTLSSIQSLAMILGNKINNTVPPEVFLSLSLKIAKEMHLNDEDSQALHYATLLKDTAKIGIPEEILKKPGSLTFEELRLLKKHTLQGAKIVQSFESLKPVVPIILHSREKYDGTGYPDALKGEAIPVGARILAVINAFEAIVFGRPYRSQSSVEEALREIERNRGTQFDPKVVDVFVRLVHREHFEAFLK